MTLTKHVTALLLRLTQQLVATQPVGVSSLKVSWRGQQQTEGSLFQNAATEKCNGNNVDEYIIYIYFLYINFGIVKQYLLPGAVGHSPVSMFLHLLGSLAPDLLNGDVF